MKALTAPTDDDLFSRFFTPTPGFWEWLEEKAQGRTVVDIGCGRGDLIRECEARGLAVIGIDPCYSLFGVTIPADLTNRILPMGVEDCLDFIEGDDLLLLCCRPCHDGFPIHVVEARRRSPFYYVGFNKNLERDLGRDCVTDILHKVPGGGPAGQDGEEIYQVHP